MAVYTWACDECNTITEVTCSMDQYDVPPAGGCSKCPNKKIYRVIQSFSKHQFIKVWGGIAPFHDEAYSKRGPIR